jgi:acetyl-CoA carboxylase carboxyl transferase subunit alpha
MGGAHRQPEIAIAAVGAAVAQTLDGLDGKDAATLKAERRDRYYKIGRLEQPPARTK